MLKIIPRHQFASLERRYGTGRKARTFSRWNQFIHLMFIQLTGRVSLRDGVLGLGAKHSSLYHLGARPAARSTFADANRRRPATFYKALFQQVYQRCCPWAPKHKFEFENKLYSLDASVIKLCLTLFPWASYRKAKGGIKLQVLLDHDGYLPAFMTASEARQHEIIKARSLHLPKGSIVAMDLGYIDYAWFRSLTKQGTFFVTRQKKNADYRVVKRQAVDKKSGVTSDQLIELSGPKGAKCPHPLRRVGYRDPETKKHLVFLTNHFELPAETVADIYKERWQIEIFFRFIKQNLKVKAFLGNSENAVMTQLYVALIAYLLLCYLKFCCRLGVSLQRLLQVLELNLFVNRTVQELFKPPGGHVDKQRDLNQLTLNFA
jgi:putative transposase